MKKTILIVTNKDDIHADLVAERIVGKGGIPFRLNLDEFPAHYLMDLSFQRGHWMGELAHRATKESMDIQGIGAVWTRKNANFQFKSDDLAPQEKAHAISECEHILAGLLHCLDCYWMNHPGAVRYSSWKGEQLQRAARLGFRVPTSLISNHEPAVHRFRASVSGDIIFKSMSSPFLAADKVDADHRITRGLPTTLITQEHVGLLHSIEEIPCLFQEYIPKKYELRVTVVGDTIYAAKIHSQENDRTKVDFRDYTAEVRYEPAVLPADVERRCLDFVHSYGLTYGALDLICTPADEHVFLENNPAGQFLFVEQRVPELKILDGVADCLLMGAEGKA